MEEDLDLEEESEVVVVEAFVVVRRRLRVAVLMLGMDDWRWTCFCCVEEGSSLGDATAAVAKRVAAAFAICSPVERDIEEAVRLVDAACFLFLLWREDESTGGFDLVLVSLVVVVLGVEAKRDPKLVDLVASFVAVVEILDGLDFRVFDCPSAFAGLAADGAGGGVPEEKNHDPAVAMALLHDSGSIAPVNWSLDFCVSQAHFFSTMSQSSPNFSSSSTRLESFPSVFCFLAVSAVFASFFLGLSWMRSERTLC